MLKQPLFRFIFALVALIALLHNLAFKLNFYWTLWWFDVLMHFLGGLLIGLFALWFIFLSPYIQKYHVHYLNALFVTLISIFVIGIGWEFFELWAGSPVVGDYALDTAIDLMMDMLGALSGYAYIVFYYIKTTAT